MTRAQIAALGHPDGEVLDKAVALATHMEKKGFPQKGVSVDPIDDNVIANFLLKVKARPGAHTHISYHKPVQALAWAWLGRRREEE